MMTDLFKDPREKYGAVIYTDGSSRPSPGYIGWGAHGYIYDTMVAKKPINVDGYYLTNKGYLTDISSTDVVCVTPDKYFDFFGSSDIQGTNNQAEAQAFCHTLEHLSKYNLYEIYVLTDSNYLRNGTTQLFETWVKNGWVRTDGQPLANIELWKKIYQLITGFKEREIKFDIVWVKAHNNIFGNTHADILSVIGTNYSITGVRKEEFKFSDVKNYWKHTVEKHPFINFKRIYFNSESNNNIMGQYFLADPGGGDFIIGKRIPETGFAVVKLKNPDEIIELIKDKQSEIAKDLNAIIMIKLDSVYSKQIYPYLLNYGKYCLLSNKKNLNLSFINNESVTIEINPTGLSLRAIESFNLLEDLLAMYLQYKEDPLNYKSSISLNTHDITDVFYQIDDKITKGVVTKICTLKPEYTTNFKNLLIPITEICNEKNISLNVPLILGIDLLPRNNLKKLETLSPKVFLLTWRESERSLRYATVIECETGIGIWSNFYADKLFF